MTKNSNQDGGLWGLGRFSSKSSSRPSSNVPPPLNPTTSSPPNTSFNTPIVPSAPSAPSAPSVPTYPSIPQEGSLYPKIYSPTHLSSSYPSVAPSSQGHYPHVANPYQTSPYVSQPPSFPYANSHYPPHPPPGIGIGASYDQTLDPTALNNNVNNNNNNNWYVTSPPQMQGGRSPYGPASWYPSPSLPPHMQGVGGTHHDSFRLGHADGYSSSGSSGDFQTNSMRSDISSPGPYGGGPYVHSGSGSPTRPPFAQSESRYPNSLPPVYHSGPVYSNHPGVSQSLVPINNVTDMVPTSKSGRHSLARHLLHGTLEVTVFEAVNLPNMDMFSEKLRQFVSNLPVPLQKAKAKSKMHAPNTGITSDPYVTVVLAGARVARTRVISNDTNPMWNEHFSIPVAHHVYHIVFTVKDQDVLGTQHIGDVKIPVESVLNGRVIEGWYDILNNQNKICREDARIRFSVSYTPVELNPMYTLGVGGDDLGVQFTYFPARKGCRLTLYQDTHIYDNSLPVIQLERGRVYEHRRCWEDMCTAINDAQHVIYIAGWSVYDKVKLIRDPNRRVPEGGDLTLGELLKRKAMQGIRVLLLIWDDKTSHDNPFIKTEGVMSTHDEETKKYFKHTGVRCVLAPRYGASKMSWFRQQVVGTLYTHHQKITLVDTGPPRQRTLTAFIGGLDLTEGRWDTPCHSLFSSLQKEHKDDFRQKSWPHLPDSGGPREPWHDWHCKIEGHAAYDVLTNFEQRWKKATRLHDEELLDIDRRENLMGPSNRAPISGDPALFLYNDFDSETWNVQIFRSIDAGSVKGFPTNIEDVQKQHLVWGKSVAIDTSIQMAYIKAIRSAQHFIYIENQYFLGSSYNWPDYDVAGANHLIPMELALKICSKIKEGKRFSVYVVIPMWPEGIPDTGPVQEILFFQTQTMKMMYTKVADALRDAGLSSYRKPTDYLNFYCLGARETLKPGEPAPLKPPDSNSRQGKSQKNRRMMIYVHSKGMIVDDEYVISGSANINQRSMDGSRDTEIAMGGFQPHYTWVRKMSHPRGQVYGYRMSLWAEHLGTLERVFEEPESLECVQRVNNMGERNWQQYIAPEITDMKGHLMCYPLKIGEDGSVTNLPGYETFPDVGGKIMGCNQIKLPDDLTA